MGRQFNVLLVLLLTSEAVRSIQVKVGTREPIVAEGQDATLTCQFDIPEEQLYSVKWYKGNKQFYSYMPSSDRPYRIFYVEGVSINVSRSSPQDVTLTGITKETAGLYRCEVIGEGPWFPISSADKYIEVVLLPENGPFITGAQELYRVGDVVDVNCTSEPSRPVTHLTWWIDNENAPPSQLYSQSVHRIETLNATSTALRLTFRIGPERLPQLTLTCLANIGLVYHSRAAHWARVLATESLAPEPEPTFENIYNYTDIPNNGFEENENVDNNGVSSISSRGSLVFIYLLLIFTNI